MIDLTEAEAMELIRSTEGSMSLFDSLPRGLRMIAIGLFVECVRVLQAAGYRIERPHLRSN